MKSSRPTTPSRIVPMVFAALFLTIAASAQPGRESQGRHFLIAFPDTTAAFIAGNDSAVPAYAALIVFSSSPTVVTVRSGSFSRSIPVDPNASTVVPLIEPGGPARVFLDRPGVADRAVFDVTSDADIGIYCYFVTKDGSEAFSPLPVESWGKEYYAVGFRSDVVYDLPVQPVDENPKPKTVDAPGEVLVIASEDNTTVHVDGVSGLMPPAGGGIVIRLDAGEAYLLETPRALSGGLDVTGAHLTADRPIGVIAGNTRTAAMGSTTMALFTGNSVRNSIVEWMPPVDAAGTTFLLRRIAPVTGPIVGFVAESPPVVRCLAIAPGITTVLSSSGDGFAIAQGRASDILLASPSGSDLRVTSDKPMLAFASTGFAAWNIDPIDGVTGYDVRASAMAELVPEDRWISSGRFHAPGYPGYLRHYVSIVSDAPVLLDGRPVTMTPVRNTHYGEALVEITPGDHLLLAEGCGKFGAVAYGHAAGYEEYVPPRSRRSDEPAIASAPHPSRYKERLGIAYAYPVLGRGGAEASAGAVSIARDYVAVPGDSLLIPIVLDSGRIEGAASLSFVVTFDSLLMGAAADMRDRLIAGTGLAGWSLTEFREESGRVLFTLTAPPAAPPVVPGRLVNLGFVSFIRIVDSLTLRSDEYVEVAASITMAPACLPLASSPGRVHFRICGTNSRQIERGAGKVALDRSRPDPFSGRTEIGFSIAFGGRVTLEVYDGWGGKVATLVDGDLPAGRHVVAWDATGFPSGLYRYRVRSGEWSADGSMTLVK